MKKNTIFNVHLIALIALAYFPINAFSSNENWKVVKIPNSSVNVMWDANKDVVDRFSRSSGGDFFGFRRIEPAIIEHSPTGLRSASTLPATIESTVSREAVLAGSYGLFKKGASFAIRGANYVGWALLAKDVYDLLKEDVEAQGYVFDATKQEFLKTYAAKICIWHREGRYGVDEHVVTPICEGVDSSIMRHFPNLPKDLQTLMDEKLHSMAQAYWPKRKAQLIELEGPGGFGYPRGFVLDECNFNWNGGTCLVVKNGDYRSGVSFSLRMNEKYQEQLTKQQFEQIAQRKIDQNPTPFIKANPDLQIKEQVKIENGKIVTLGPVTGEDGKPKQIKITFGQDAQGNTTAAVEEIQRPDLTPGSAEAPETKPKPAPTPETNPKEKENPREEDQDNPKPTPTPGETPSPNESPKDRREEKKPDGNGGLLCDLFPKILACAEMGEPSENDFEGIAIPKAVNEETWSPDNMFPSSGVCPKDKTFHVFGKAFSVSYQPLCTLMENVRFAVIIGFIIMSAFITFGSLRKE
ncbi:IgG-binding virulence factor TspB family protein [Neisseria polysaccharea]|uniref:IgG-binding virulence factor TspB family protein n=1 Tax=Neisseria polysaccharea TaxID=489 RepID=UPI00272A4E42|nr:IgG-binding virulence factor TspB family protein [Neisseria polysaccharea]